MSVSANTMRFSGLAEALGRSSPGGSVTPGGSPPGKALWTLPLTRAASV